MKIFGCHGNELPIKEILYQSVFGDKYYMIGHKFTISVTMDVSPFAWCLARAVLNNIGAKYVCVECHIVFLYCLAFRFDLNKYVILTMECHNYRSQTIPSHHKEESHRTNSFFSLNVMQSFTVV